MAQWSRADRTLYTKVVYYGPAFGGKTTNLQSLHRITDPAGEQKLLNLQTAGDRTLFFDLLPFELGDILGYQVAMKVYTVPGQVRYDTTRQVVLAGADAVVFVADSSSDRKDQNVWSLQNLRMNMRAKQLDPSRVPVLFQLNKQDLPYAAPVTQVASWLGIPPDRGYPAVAVDGRGVLETFMAASKAMLEKVISAADARTRKEIQGGELARQLERAFAPHVARRDRGAKPIERPSVEPDSHSPAALEGEELLERSVATSLRLGERLTTEVSRAARLEREAEALRQLSDSLRSVGASFDRLRIIDAALTAVNQILETPAVSLLRKRGNRGVEVERSLGERPDPLAELGCGRSVLQRMLASEEPQVVSDLSEACPDASADGTFTGLRAAASVPVVANGERALLLAYAPAPEGSFSRDDVRFLETVAGHLAAGLEKARLHEELASHTDELEAVVDARTRQLREAYRTLRHMEQMKDRFLSNLSHEMRTPLTAILSAAHVVRDYNSSESERRELVGSIVSSAEMLEQQLADLFRLVNLEQGDRPIRPEDVRLDQLIEDAIQLAGHPGVQFKIHPDAGTVHVDREGVVQALSNLIDNAVKFSPPSSLVRIVTAPCHVCPGEGEEDGVAVSVLDRGPGVPASDRERIFAPFEQGGDSMTSKPRGIGIGLYEARTMARRHEGEVAFESRSGGGSEFRLTVPIAAKHEPGNVERDEPAAEVTGV